MESAFSETRRAAELLQQFGGFIFSTTTFFQIFLPCAILVPALRPCLTNTAFASSLVRSALLHCVTSPVSIISGDGCSIFNVQCRAHIFIDFCAAVHYTELIFRHSFQRFCSCPQRRNLKNFLLFKTVERIVCNLSKIWRRIYGKVEVNHRYF